MRRLILIALLVCLTVPVTASAQSNPFGPLPPADLPAPAETPEPVEFDDGSLDPSVLLIIGGVVIAAFLGIGWYITRDARAHLTDADRRSLELEREGVDLERRKSEAQRKKARARTKAQKRARKKQRAR